MTGVEGRIEMALVPDRAADPLSWDWTPIGDSAKVERLAIARGQTSGGANEMQPGSMSFPLLNPGGIYTPGRADSPHHPNLVRGIPVRAVVKGQRDPYLSSTGEGASRASTPDAASLDITGDIAGAIEFECPVRIPPATIAYNVAGKYNPTGNQRSYLLDLTQFGHARFFWSTDGTLANTLGFTMELPFMRPEGGVLTLGWELDVDNGAAGRTMRWFVCRGTITDLLADPDAFEFLTDTDPGTTSIFASTAALNVGGVTDAVTATNVNYPGKIRRFLLRSGTLLAGTIVANPDFTIQAPGTTSFSDTAAVAKTWTINTPASITDDQVRMVGELASNSPTWPALSKDAVAETKWTVMGPLSRMRQGSKPLRSCLYRFITSAQNVAAVKAYWPLEDGSGATSAFSPIAGVEPMSIGGGSFQFASDSTLDSSQPLPHVNSLIAFAGEVPPYTATQTRVDLFVRIDTPNPTASGSTAVIALDTNGTVRRWTFFVDDTGVAVIGLDAFNGNVVTSTFSSVASMFDTWSLWSFDITQSGGTVFWQLDIVPIPGGSIVASGAGSFAGTVGTVTALHNWLTPAPLSDGISFGHMIVSTGKALGWLAPADTAFVGEPAGQRFFRLCSEQNIQAFVDGPYGATWPVVLRAGGKPMGPQRPANLLELLTECALVENARIGESRELLALTYRSRHNAQDPALRITAELGNPFAPTGDSQGLVNDATVSLPEGSSHRQTDQVSIDASGLYEAAREVNAQTVLQLPDLTSWWLLEALWPGLRVPVLRVELGNNPALFDGWLALSPGDLVRITGLPPGFPEDTLDVLVDGYVEEIATYGWALTLNVRPAGPWVVGVRDEGIRDTGGSVLDASFEAGTDTTMDVETTLGPLWAVTAATNSALPFDVDVGGARITVTAIGAASGQVQTFTVTQTPVNGIVKAVPAGTPVRVWRPARRAFMRS